MSEAIVTTPELSDGYAYQHTTWPVAGAIRARLLILHGVQSHAGWYPNLGRTLAEKGFEAHFPDRRGSGANQRDRGHTPSADRLLLDVVEQLRALRAATPAVPVGLVGISWGGKLAVITAGNHPGLVDALALICPGLMPRVGVSPSERLRIAFAYFFNRRKLFAVPLADPALFTDNPEGQSFIAADPLALRKATAGLLAASTFIDRKVQAIVKKLHQPTLLMLAGQDRIVDNAKTLAYAKTLATTDLEVIEYPQGHHTLEFDPDPSRYANDLADWFGSKLSLPRTER